MPRPTRGLVAAITLFLTALMAAVASAQMPTTANQVPLTPALVEAFIASYPEVRASADGLSDQYGVDAGDDDNPSTGWQAWLAVTGAQNALNAACQNYGFQDFQQWLQVFVAIGTAYAFVQGGGMDAQMSQAAAQIQNSPGLSQAQKDMMIQQMQAAMGVVNAMMPPQGNLDAVTPYMPQLAVLFDDD